jgi:glucose/arabinose dehydrogenase
LAAVGASVCASTAGAAVQLDKIGDFSQPVFITSPPGNSNRLLVVEQGGSVRLVKDGTLVDRPFLTVKHVLDNGEQGLLSIAFHPDYADNGLLYVYYVRDDKCSGSNCDIEIAEYRRKSNADRINAKTYRRVLQIPHRDHANHNGGQLQFGPDGFLYAGTGDGGGSGNPEGTAQNVNSLLGKLLRINPRASSRKAYTVPNGNPFVGSDGADEVWAYGLRNPFRFSFDHRTGDLWIGDVGQGKREEIDFLASGQGAGSNFGWNVCEGDLQYPSDNPCSAPPPGYVAPLVAYPHSGGACAVTGGYVSRDRTASETLGKYVLADFCAGNLVALTRTGGSVAVESLGLNVPQTSSFGEDADCRLYVASLGGPVYRIESDNPSGSPGCDGGATSRRKRR